MRRKVVAVWVSLLIMISSIVILVEIAERVEAPTTLYVGGGGPGNYSKIQWAIDNASDGDTVFVYNGTYYENVIVNKTLNITGVDRNTTIIDGGGNGDVVSIIVNWVNFTGFTIIGGGSGNYDAGIELNNIQKCSIIKNKLHSNNKLGIYLYLSNNNNVSSNSVYSNNYGGIYIRNSNQNDIINNSVWNHPHGIILFSSNGNYIENNNLSFNSQEGILVSASNNNNVYGNIAFKNQVGIELTSSTGNDIISNNASSNTLWGFYLSSSTGNTLMSNKAELNNQRGILLHESNDNIVIDNIALNNRFGIFLTNSAGNNVSDNFASKSEYGFYISSNYNDITTNTASMNDYGIYIWFSDWNNITGNNIYLNNIDGIHMEGSKNNSIYHNNLINNANQAYDDDWENYWNDTYPNGGNFWYDYNGMDFNSTPSQNIPPPDGIGDDPYVIDFDSQDYYPLMTLFGNNILLWEGWNFISIPHIQSDSSITSIFKSIEGNLNALQWYNVSDTSDQWKHNHTQKSQFLNDLDIIENTMGFWIHITDPDGVLFNYPGTPPSINQTIQLHPGWNMVGYPSLSNHNRTAGLNNLTFDTHVDAIQWYNAATKAWHFMGPDDPFVPGRGYWVHSKVDAEWEVPL